MGHALLCSSMGEQVTEPLVAVSPLVGELRDGMAGKRPTFLLSVAHPVAWELRGISSSDHPLVRQSPRGPVWRPEALLASRDGAEAKRLVMLSGARLPQPRGLCT